MECDLIDISIFLMVLPLPILSLCMLKIFFWSDNNEEELFKLREENKKLTKIVQVYHEVYQNERQK